MTLELYINIYTTNTIRQWYSIKVKHLKLSIKKQKVYTNSQLNLTAIWIISKPWTEMDFDRLTTLHHDFIRFTLHFSPQAQLAAGPFQVLHLYRWPLLLHLSWLRGVNKTVKDISFDENQHITFAFWVYLRHVVCPDDPD